jgi:hypothetical protein
MAANINLHQPRVEVALTERDENSNGQAATPHGQTPPQSESTIAAPSEQHGQSGDGGGSEADAHDSQAPLPRPIENETSKPSFMRYGLGDTVIMGAPNYARDYSVNSSKFEQPLEPAEPIPRVATPMPKPGSTNPSALTPIPMPKPGGIASPTPALASPPSLSKPAPAPIHNAPQLGGAPVVTPAANTATPEPGGSDLAFEQGMADLTLGDPLNKELIARYEQDHPNTNLVEYGNATADHLVATYGEARLNDMAKLHQALAGVRDDYLNALTATEASCALNIDGRFLKVQSGTSGDGGTEAPVFDNEAFTRWYVQQDGLSNRAFAANYAYGGVGTVTHSQGDNTVPLETTVLSGGTSVIVHERVETSSEGGTSVNTPRFAAPGLFILGGPTCGIELHDPKAVWFDPTLGFVTSATNVVVKDDLADRIVPVLVATAFSAGLASVGALPTAATFGGGTSGAVLAGAANGVITSVLVTGAQGGDITFKGLFQAALTGGIMGGLNSLSSYRDFSNLGLDTGTNTVTNYALRAVSITGQATVQGALRELVGGRFRDGFTDGMVQGLAGEITRVLNGDIAGRLGRGEITADQARVLNQMATMTGSAIRAAANPNDPAFAFAQDYLTQLLGPSTVPEVRGTVFDDDGNLTPGVVDTTKPIGNQAQQIEARLVQQGYSASDARLVAEGWLVNRIADSIQAKEPTTSRNEALRQARAAFNDPNPIVIDVTTRARVPGQEIAEQFLGALIGTGGVAVDVLKGTIDLLAMSADGYAQVANVLTGGDLFPDAGRRNEARSEILNQLANNWDKLPGAMVDQFNAQLEQANRLDAQDTPESRLEAARIRSHVFGGAALAVLTLGETAVASGSRVISSLADARATLGEIVSAGPLRGSLAAQSGAIDVVAMLEGGRFLIRNGSEFVEAMFVDGRRLVLLRPATGLIDDAMLLRLRNGEQIVNPADVARIERSMQIRQSFVNADGTWTRKPGDVSKPEYYLEFALRAEGKEPPGTRGDYTPHHLTMFDGDMAPTQRQLSSVGIGPNDAINGAWLERGYHQVLHTDDYKAWVRDLVERGVQTGGRQGAEDALRYIADHLRQHKPIPPRK